MSTIIWWVADPGDPDDYEARYEKVSPKFATRELAVAWKERAEQDAYAARLEHRSGIAAAYERHLAEAQAKSQQTDEYLVGLPIKEAILARARAKIARDIDMFERALHLAHEQDALLANISLAAWLTGTREVVVGGWHHRYRVDFEAVLGALDKD